MGCGACVNACPTEALEMKQRPILHHPPANKAEQLSRIMKEKIRN